MSTATRAHPILDALLEDASLEAPTICPHCGGDVRPSSTKLIHRSGWSLIPTETWYKGELLPFTKQQSYLFYILAKSSVPLHGQAISYRISKLDCDNGPNIVAVQMSRIKKKLESLSIPLPIVSNRSRGYEWVDPTKGRF